MEGGKMTFAQLLRDFRKRHSLSQTALGELLGVSFATISAWERGVNEPPEIAKEGAAARMKRFEEEGE
jgi:transcriptional regulator with XRE-family HTH domain